MASLALRVGVNLQRTQPLLIFAPLEAVALVEELAREAYRLDSGRVHCFYEDPTLLRLALTEMNPVFLNHLPSVVNTMAADALSHGAAILNLWGPDPVFGKGISAERIARLHDATYRSALDAQSRMKSSRPESSALMVATRSWARSIHPTLDNDNAFSALSQMLSNQLLLDRTDPLAAWQERLDLIDTIRRNLEMQRFIALQIKDETCNIEIGLSNGPTCWTGGCSVNARKMPYVPVLPTCSLSAATNPAKAYGTIVFNRELILAGQQIRAASIVFEHDKPPRLSADRGAQTMIELFGESSEGVLSISEIGIPLAISNQSLHTGFHNPIIDSLGALRVSLTMFDSVEGLRNALPPRLSVDAFFGSATTSIDGVRADGRKVPLMRDGRLIRHRSSGSLS